MPIAGLGSLDRVLVAGSFLREEAPLIAHRLRQAAKRGAQVHMLHSIDDDWLMPVASKTIVPRSEEHTSELQSRLHLVCRLLLEKKNDDVQNRSDPGEPPERNMYDLSREELKDVTFFFFLIDEAPQDLSPFPHPPFFRS